MLQEDLISRYPKLFSDSSIIECSDGWSSIIFDFCNVISGHIKYLPEEIKDQIYIVQIKEKFGALRIYMSLNTPYINGAIALAETISARICEVCGKDGVKKSFKGYIRTVCSEHER